MVTALPILIDRKKYQEELFAIRFFKTNEEFEHSKLDSWESLVLK